MLVLSRRIGERIIVPDGELTITVLSVHGNTVRLGISAPDDVNVYREELWLRLGQSANGSRSENDPQAKGGS